MLVTHARRICEADLNSAATRLPQVATCACEGAAGANGARESVDPSAGLLPYLRAGARKVRFAIGGVVELVGPNSTELLCQSAGELYVILERQRESSVAGRAQR